VEPSAGSVRFEGRPLHETLRRDRSLRRAIQMVFQDPYESLNPRMTVGETLELRPGSIVVLDRMAGEPVDLLVNGTPIARGEVVVIDEEFGLRITDVLGDDGAARPREAAGEAEPPAAPDAPAEAPGTV